MTNLLSFNPEPFDTELFAGLFEAEDFEGELGEMEQEAELRGRRLYRPARVKSRLRARPRPRRLFPVVSAPLYAPYALVEEPVEPPYDEPDAEPIAEPDEEMRYARRRPSVRAAWVQRLAPLLRRAAPDIPLDFLLGWIAVESGGDIASHTRLDERGYFQLHPEESRTLRVDHKRLTVDPVYSVESGVKLVRHYAKRAQALGFAPGTDLFWHAVKLLHWLPKGVVVTLAHMRRNGFQATNWAQFREYMLKHRAELLKLLVAKAGTGWDPASGVRNVDALFARGHALAAGLGSAAPAAPLFPVPSTPPAPIPARPAPGPTRKFAPDAGPAPGFDPAAFRARVVATALQELTRWEDGGMKETEPRAGKTLQDYWKTGACRNYSLAQLANKEFQKGAPWSAAFVSWVMKNAGAGNLFKCSAAHAEYVRAAIANRKTGAANPFKAYRVSELVPSPGDIVAKPRDGSGAIYDNIPAGAKLHGDIVVEVTPTHIFVVGGNVDNSVKRRRLRLVNGRIAEGGYFVIIRAGAAQPPVTPSPGPAPAPSPVRAGAAPRLIKRETVAQGETLYFAIDLKIPGAPARTGVFLPKGFKPGAGVDVLLYLHGHKAAVLAAPAIEQYWNAARFPYGALRESVVASGRNVILVAPTLGPKSQAGKLIAPGGFDVFLGQVLAGLRDQGPWRGAPAAPAAQNIVLACHSGGGAPMRHLAGGRDRAAALIRECWGFDCTYNKGDDVFWAAFGRSRPGAKVHIYYIAGSPTAPLAEKLKKAAPPNVVVQASREGRHNYVPLAYFEERLRRSPFLAAIQGGGGASPAPAPVPAMEPDPKSMTHAQFIEFVGGLARKAKGETGVPASVTVAQAVVESGWGKHSIGDAKNLFGIKGRGPAGSIRVKTKEFVNGQWITIEANFAKYETFAQSVAEHARLFLRNRIYAKAMQAKDDADAFARAIHKAGYATAPNYADVLIALMKRYDLYRFDR